MEKEKPKTAIQKVYKNFIDEAEDFFVLKFIDSPKIETMFSKCLDIIFNVTGQMDHGRGIVAQNPKYGQGKSFFFDVVHHRFLRTRGNQIFVKTTARELCDVYTSTKKGEDPQERLKKFINVRNLYIDDIGDELKDGQVRSNYSNKLNVLRYVILKRYDLWIEKGWKLHGNTNLTIKEIAKNYDGRVADRMMQMCYLLEFAFLTEGSFRQIEETRKLTEQEISKNWKKYEKQKKVEKIDLEKYFNELISEPEKYFDNKDHVFWGFVRKYLQKKGFLNDENFNEVNEKMLESSSMILKRQVRESKRSSLKHAPGNVRSNLIDKAVADIGREQIEDVAKNMIARRKFMELHKSKYIFK